jgi:NAD(P)H-hydrate epimerase
MQRLFTAFRIERAAFIFKPMPRLTRQQAREIDRLAVERYRIPSILLMENAARAAADVAWEMLAHRTGPVVILCGGGNNGGDGLAAARHLHLRGISVTIALTTDPAKYKGDARINWEITQAMEIQTMPADPYRLEQAAPLLIVDAVFGTGLTRPPRDPFPDIARAVAAGGAPVLAIDLPSGLDCDTGLPLGSVIAATRTVTFAGEKAGFANPDSRRYTGEVTVADIGCPIETEDMKREDIKT